MRALYRLWSVLPRRGQQSLVYLLGPKVTMGVSAVIADHQGRLLLVHHTYRRPAWGFPSGLVGRHEQPADALARELREELGVEASAWTLLCADHGTRQRHLTLYYRTRITGTLRHGTETDAHRYVAPADLPALLGAPLPAALRVLLESG